MMDEMLRVLEGLRPAIERLGGRGHDGEDLYGDVSLACVEKKGRYDWSHPGIKGRVMRIARNLHVTRHRRERLRRHEMLPPDCSDFASPARSDICNAEHTLASHEAVRDLPEAYRRVGG